LISSYGKGKNKYDFEMYLLRLFEYGDVANLFDNVMMKDEVCQLRKGDVMKLVVTVVGVDRVGIIAGVSTVLADHGVNIMSINQTILDGVFNMIMMCETKSEDMKNLTAIQEALTTQGKELGVEIRAQHADIFLSMHRVG